MLVVMALVRGVAALDVDAVHVGHGSVSATRRGLVGVVGLGVVLMGSLRLVEAEQHGCPGEKWTLAGPGDLDEEVLRLLLHSGDPELASSPGMNLSPTQVLAGRTELC